MTGVQTCSSDLDWLKQNQDSDYDLPEEVIDKTVAKYKEAYEQLTGEPFEA